jgi:hypothetical protein
MSVLSGWSTQNKWNALFGLWALHGIFALGKFLVSQNPPFDLSFEEILLAGVLLFWVVLNIFLIVSLSRKSVWLAKLPDLFKNPAVRDRVFVFATFAFFVRICLGIFQSIADRSAFWYVGYLDRLSPLLDLAAIILAEIIALIVFFAFYEKAEDKKLLKSFSVKLLFTLVLLSVTALYISKTGMGIDPIYKGDWARGLPAVPLLEWQILLACIFCVGMVIAESNQRILNIPRLDLWMALAVWVAAVAFWLGQPIVPNAAALEPREPNFEVYPFSDAQTYDEFSQSILVGNGFEGKIPPRPLYLVFLAFQHLLVGQGYGNVIALQTMIFALFPVLLYFFGREFFGRPIGISIALLAILRDYTSNLVSPFTGNLSYSKLYLSEIPTAMLLILFLLVGMRWIKSGFPVFLGFLLGGILGVSMLIRAQGVVAFPILLLLAFISQPKKLVSIIKGAAPALVVIVMVISPWLWRNWRLTGELVFDNPISQMANLALRYNRLNGEDVNIMPLPGETDSEYNARLSELANHAISSNPWGIVTGIANSFLNHGVNNVLVFPLRNELGNPGEFWTPTDPFWERWEGRPTFSQGLLLVFYVSLFGLGLSTAWQRNGWLGLLPLGVNLVYNLSTSVALISGQRFMLTMDWSVYLYYMIGLFTLLSVFLFVLESGQSMILKWYEAGTPAFIQPVDRKKWGQYVFFGILFFGIGASLPLSEMVFPKAYPPVSQSEILSKLDSSPALKQSGIDAACFQKLVVENQLNNIQGRAMYPRYYEANDGETFTDSAGYKAVDEGRLVFQLIGRTDQRVVFPMSEPPDFFPNASDATLFLDAGGDVWSILVEQGDAQRMYFSETLVTPLCD